MYVVLAEFDKGPMLGRKREKIVFWKFVQKYPEKIWGADGKFSENLLKRFEGRTESFQKYPEKGLGGVDSRKIDRDL